MTSFVLKIIAITTMLIDHIGAIFIPNNTMLYMVSRSIGRLAFPIFVFLIVEGFHHTKNVNKYLTRLGIFALISEIPFDIAFYNIYFRSDITADFRRIFELISAKQFNAELKNIVTTDIGRMMLHQNVFFTLFLGLLLITIMSKVEQKFKKKIIVYNLINAVLTIGFCILAELLSTDYSYYGILLIAAFYLFRGNKILLTLSLLIVTGYLMGDNGQITISIFATLSMIFIALYNGEKGKNIKYIFYIFYPAHLFILYLIGIFI